MTRIIFNCFLVLLLVSFSQITWSQQPYHYNDTIAVNKLFASAIRDHAFPGGCIVAGSIHQTFIKHCYGFHTYKQVVPDTIDSMFDLASLTKVIATTTAIMKLYDQHSFALDDKVIKYLPTFSGPTARQTQLKSKITIRDLLTHLSGLPPDNQVQELKSSSIQSRWKVTLITPVIIHRDEREIYSDVNFELLGKIVEAITKQSLDGYSEQQIFKPLGMLHTFFNPSKQYKANLIPTGHDRHGDLLLGIVNDPIARSLGGIAGHAGLFSTISDLQQFAIMLLNQGRLYKQTLVLPTTLATFIKRENVISHNSRALGWDTAYDPQSIFRFLYRHHFHRQPHQFSAGLYIDPDAFGHTGYTGTSMWISPRYGIYVILLTNSIFPYKNLSIKHHYDYWSQQINSAVWRDLGFTHRNALYVVPKTKTIS